MNSGPHLKKAQRTDTYRQQVRAWLTRIFSLQYHKRVERKVTIIRENLGSSSDQLLISPNFAEDFFQLQADGKNHEIHLLGDAVLIKTSNSLN